jgi:hypothetical protein
VNESTLKAIEYIVTEGGVMPVVSFEDDGENPGEFLMWIPFYYDTRGTGATLAEAMEAFAAKVIEHENLSF